MVVAGVRHPLYQNGARPLSNYLRNSQFNESGTVVPTDVKLLSLILALTHARSCTLSIFLCKGRV